MTVLTMFAQSGIITPASRLPLPAQRPLPLLLKSPLYYFAADSHPPFALSAHAVSVSEGSPVAVAGVVAAAVDAAFQKWVAIDGATSPSTGTPTATIIAIGTALQRSLRGQRQRPATDSDPSIHSLREHSGRTDVMQGTRFTATAQLQLTHSNTIGNAGNCNCNCNGRGLALAAGNCHRSAYSHADRDEPRLHPPDKRIRAASKPIPRAAPSSQWSSASCVCGTPSERYRP